MRRAKKYTAICKTMANTITHMKLMSMDTSNGLLNREAIIRKGCDMYKSRTAKTLAALSGSSLHRRRK